MTERPILFSGEIDAGDATAHRRFVAKTRPASNGCVLWTGSLNANGYGFKRIPSQYSVRTKRAVNSLTVERGPKGGAA